MFSYDAKVFPLNTELRLGNSVVKARAHLIVDDTLEIKDFRVMETGGELWVSGPSQKSAKPDPETGKHRYFDTVLFIDSRGEGERHSPRQKEIQEFIKGKYLELISGKGNAARAQQRQSAPKKSAASAMSDVAWGDDEPAF